MTALALITCAAAALMGAELAIKHARSRRRIRRRLGLVASPR